MSDERSFMARRTIATHLLTFIVVIIIQRHSQEEYPWSNRTLFVIQTVVDIPIQRILVEVIEILNSQFYVDFQ